MNTVHTIVGRLGASHISAELRLPYSTVASWKARGVIPSEHWSALVAMSLSKGFDGITFESLALMHATRRDPAAQTEVSA